MNVTQYNGEVIDLTKIDPEMALGGVSEQWLQCRELGHHWRNLSLQRSQNWGIDRILKCACGTERKDTLNTWGRVAKRVYIYPRGYQMKGAQEVGVNRESFRREVLRRAGFLHEDRQLQAV